MFCEHCGRAIKAGEPFCVGCGSMQPDNNSAATAAAPESCEVMPAALTDMDVGKHEVGPYDEEADGHEVGPYDEDAGRHEVGPYDEDAGRHEVGPYDEEADGHEVGPYDNTNAPPPQYGYHPMYMADFPADDSDTAPQGKGGNVFKFVTIAVVAIVTLALLLSSLILPMLSLGRRADPLPEIGNSTEQPPILPPIAEITPPVTDKEDDGKEIAGPVAPGYEGYEDLIASYFDLLAAGRGDEIETLLHPYVSALLQSEGYKPSLFASEIDKHVGKYGSKVKDYSITSAYQYENSQYALLAELIGFEYAEIELFIQVEVDATLIVGGTEQGCIFDFDLVRTAGSWYIIEIW